MTTTLPTGRPQGFWTAGRNAACALLFMSGALLKRLDAPHRTPFDVVLWTAGLVLALYGCVWVIGFLRSQPLSSRSDLRLQGLAVLIILAVAAGVAGAAALSGQWVEASESALVAAGSGTLVWVVARHLRSPVAPVPNYPPPRHPDA